MFDSVALFRRRFVPNEITWLKDDEIIFMDDEKIITRWKSLKPRSDFSGGESVYYRKKGIKVSRILDSEGNFLHWYCDIITEQDASVLKELPDDCRMKNGAADYISNLDEHSADQKIVFTDLLVDIIINPNGLIEVADLDECSDMLKKGMITVDQLDFALRTTHDFLALLYSRYDKNADFTSDDFVKL